ncbi:MAG: serine/threonine protein kinase, partial [Myxococcales bacterium]|nr:serine/threonine protein kinase [Myxococcales bacterium]
MGTVYRGTQLAVQRPVAIKVLRPHVPEQDKPALVERFRREALATSRLRHPNTVSVYDFGETDDGVLYMVLELLEGKTLSAVIRESAPLPAERVAAIGRQIAKSLAEAHACGIVHRDLKP